MKKLCTSLIALIAIFAFPNFSEVKAQQKTNKTNSDKRREVEIKKIRDAVNEDLEKGDGLEDLQNIQGQVSFNETDTITIGFVIVAANRIENGSYCLANLVNADNKLLPEDLHPGAILLVSLTNKIINIYKNPNLDHFANTMGSWNSGTVVKVCSFPLIDEHNKCVWVKVKKLA